MDPIIAKFGGYGSAPGAGAGDPIVAKFGGYAKPTYRDLSDEELVAKGLKARSVDSNAPSELESLGRGALSGVTLGFDDEIGGAVKSAFSDKTYSQERDDLRGKKKRAQEANPLAFGAGEIGGGVATALVPGLGAARGLAGAVKAGAAVGAGAGLGNSEADLAGGDVGGALLDTAKGAALGAGAGALGYGAAKGVEKVAGKVVDKLGAGAEERLKGGLIRDLSGDQTKAMATPTLKKALNANKEKVLEAADAFDLTKVAREPGKLLEASEAALGDVGQKIGEVYQGADATGSGVKLGAITKRLASVAEEYEKSPLSALKAMGKTIRQQIDDAAETWMDKAATSEAGRPVAKNGAKAVDDWIKGGIANGVEVPASEVHNFVSSLGRQGFEGSSSSYSLVSEMRQKAWGAVKDELTRHVETVTPEAAKELTRLNRLYSGLSTVAEAAADRAAKESTRGAFSGIDAMVGGIGMMTGNPLHAAAGIATKKAIQQGIPLASRAANKALAQLYKAAQSGQRSAVATAAEEALASGAPRGVVEAIMSRVSGGRLAEASPALASDD